MNKLNIWTDKREAALLKKKKMCTLTRTDDNLLSQKKENISPHAAVLHTSANTCLFFISAECLLK